MLTKKSGIRVNRYGERAMLPDGYRVIEETDSSLIIGMFNFLLMLEEAEPFINYNGKQYKRGLLEAIPDYLIGSCCSCREYLAV